MHHRDRDRHRKAIVSRRSVVTGVAVIHRSKAARALHRPGDQHIIVQCYGVKDIDNRVRVAHREGAQPATTSHQPRVTALSAA